MQREYFGRGTIANLGDIIATHGAKKLFIVAGKRSFVSCGASEALARVCGSAGITIFDNFSVNPKLEEALEGIELINNSRPDLIIAIGGGSVIDMGKLVARLSAQPTDDYASVIKKSHLTHRGLPFVAVPTTSGTGTEATRYAVVYIDGIKYSLNHQFVLPDYSIIDPSFTYDMPPYQTAVSGMDALCQAVESYWSFKATLKSRGLSGEAVDVILKNIKKAVVEDNVEARDAMARGSNLAGKAIDITETTAPHGISYTLTSRYTIPHGHAVALILGRFFQINASHIDSLPEERMRANFGRTLAEIYTMFDCSDAATCEHRWFQLMKDLGLETDLMKLGVATEDDYRIITTSVNQRRLKNHPIPVTGAILSSLFSRS
ncbi:MAG: phosphonoacetaldehyde reductase [Desulforhopalus sp.]